MYNPPPFTEDLQETNEHFLTSTLEFALSMNNPPPDEDVTIHIKTIESNKW